VAWRHIELVRELPPQPTSKLILFALASRANDEGRCWPSMRKLCQDTGLARRTVQLHMGRLTAQGAVMREVRIGRASGLRLELQALRDATYSTAHAQESPGCGQPVPDGRIRCIPRRTRCTHPAHAVHPKLKEKIQ
jgi:DNA-binding transcriptional MocR family regulator